MLIPFFAFVAFMAASSQYPPWGPPDPSYVPMTYETPLFFASAHRAYVKHHHHK